MFNTTLKLKCKEGDTEISLLARLSQVPPTTEYAVYKGSIHQWDTPTLKLYIDLNYGVFFIIIINFRYVRTFCLSNRKGYSG
jgi:hypothetical protein